MRPNAAVRLCGRTQAQCSAALGRLSQTLGDNRRTGDEMDIEKLIVFLRDNVAEFVEVTARTMVRPVGRFQLVPSGAAAEANPLARAPTQRELWLNPKLLVFAAISIVLGTTLTDLVPGRSDSPDLLPTVAFVTIWWFIGGSVTHAVCRVLRGAGSYLETVSVYMQVLATLYVVISFLTLIASTAAQVEIVQRGVRLVPILGALLLDEPIYFFFVFQTILGLAYVPLAMKAVHRFGWIRTVTLALLPVLTIWVSVWIFDTIGILPTGWGPA